MRFELAGQRLEPAGQDIQQSRFALAVVADHAESIAGVDGQIDMPKQNMVGRVAERNIARLEQRFGGKRGMAKFEIQRFDLAQLVKFREFFKHLRSEEHTSELQSQSK